MQQSNVRRLPCVSTGQYLAVIFREASDIKYMIQLGVVTDYDENGSVIGVEVIGPEFHAKAHIFAGFNWEEINNATGMHFSFDKDNDAFYLSVVPGVRSVDQRVHPGRLILNGQSELISIEAML